MSIAAMAAMVLCAPCNCCSSVVFEAALRLCSCTSSALAGHAARQARRRPQATAELREEVQESSGKTHSTERSGEQLPSRHGQAKKAAKT